MRSAANLRWREAELPEPGAHDVGDNPLTPVPDPIAAVASGRSRVMRDKVLDLATERFSLGVTLDDRVFLRLSPKGHNIALFAVRAKAALAAVMRENQGESPGRTALDEAWQTIEGLAEDVPKRTLPIRVSKFYTGSLLDYGRVPRTWSSSIRPAGGSRTGPPSPSNGHLRCGSSQHPYRGVRWIDSGE